MNSHLVVGLVYGVIIFFTPFYFKKTSKSAHEMQSMVVTLGIIGTFVGLFLGLFNFDTNNIEGSIPAILEGLKTAFIAPIFGIFTSLFLGVNPKFYGLKEESAEQTDKEILVLIKDEILKLNKNMVGDEDSTLLSQLQKIRIGMVDKQDELNKSFKEFADRMVSDNSRSLIDALTKVMNDFNTQINTQFGENFKHLNQGVGKMLEFQEKYKDQITTSSIALEKAKSAIEASMGSLEAITKHSKEFSTTADKVEKSMSTLKNGLENLDQVAKHSKESSLAIQESIKSLRDNLSTSANQIVSDNNKLVEKLRVSLATSSENLTKQVGILDQQLGDELKKSLTSMGTQLSSLSSKFVSDYSLLAVKLDEVFTKLNR